MLRFLTLSVVALVILGCNNPFREPLPEPPLINAWDLTDTWVFGTGPEPSPGPVTGCYPTHLWRLKQTGTTVTGEVDYCPGPCLSGTEVTSGTNVNGHLRLTGTSREQPGASPMPVSYDLTVRTETGHLVGTRNGAAFWAAPFVHRSPDDCGPAPL